MHVNVNGVKAVSFSLDETVAIIGERKPWLSNLIAFKRFTPYIPGKVGKGHGARVSGQQLYALAVIGALIRAGKHPTPEYMREVFDIFEGMSDAALSEFAGGARVGAEVDEQTEEAITDYIGKLEVTGMFDENRQPMTPSDRRAVEDMKARFARVDEAIAFRSKQPWAESSRVSSGVSNRKVSDILKG